MELQKFNDAFEKVALDACKNHKVDVRIDLLSRDSMTLSEAILVVRGYGPGHFLENVKYASHFLKEWELYNRTVEAIQGDKLIAKKDGPSYWVKPCDFLGWLTDLGLYEDVVHPHVQESITAFFNEPKGKLAAIARSLLDLSEEVRCEVSRYKEDPNQYKINGKLIAAEIDKFPVLEGLVQAYMGSSRGERKPKQENRRDSLVKGVKKHLISISTSAESLSL